LVSFCSPHPRYQRHLSRRSLGEGGSAVRSSVAAQPRKKTLAVDYERAAGCAQAASVSGRSSPAGGSFRNEEGEPMQIRILILLTAAALICVTARAADDSFVGKWKLNLEKSQFTGLTYKFEDLADGKYRFAFGDDSETLHVDGKDHPTKYGSTWAVTKKGPNTWTWTRKRDGKVTDQSTWTVSDDEQTFTSMSEDKRPDGSTSHDEIKLKRTAGSSGLAGTWESTEVKVGLPTTIEIAKWQGDGYLMSNPAYKERAEFKLDGKDYADKGPRVANGTTISGKQIDDHNIELTYKLKSKARETDRWVLSADGRTLTDTVSYPGQSKQEVDVFDRQ
jgi:hypothetical protein